MPLTAVVTQPLAALQGIATNFIVAVTNPGGASLELESLHMVVTDGGGKLYPSANVGPLIAPTGLGNPGIGGQWNVPVAAGATVFFNDQVSFFGPSIAGTPAGATGSLLIYVEGQASDATVFSSTPLTVNQSLQLLTLTATSPVPNAPTPLVVSPVGVSAPKATASATPRPPAPTPAPAPIHAPAPAAPVTPKPAPAPAPAPPPLGRPATPAPAPGAPKPKIPPV